MDKEKERKKNGIVAFMYRIDHMDRGLAVIVIYWQVFAVGVGSVICKICVVSGEIC